MATIEDIRVWRDGIAARKAATGAEMFLGKPKKWFEDIHWFCPNGHVSGAFLKCEEEGDLCLACHQPVLMGPAMTEAEFALVLPALGKGPELPIGK
jgi:hypothetical protein